MKRRTANWNLSEMGVVSGADAGRLKRAVNVSRKWGDKKPNVSRASVRSASAKDSQTRLIAAAGYLKEIGRCISYAVSGRDRRLFLQPAANDRGRRALTSLLGWEPEFVKHWLQQRLHLVSPIAAVCRMSTKPFAWDAETVSAGSDEGRSRQSIEWPLTPARGFFGGITVPIHMPRGRTGSVSWYSRDASVDVEAVLADTAICCVSPAIGSWISSTHSGWRRNPASRRRCISASASSNASRGRRWGAPMRKSAPVIHRSPTTARFHIDNAVRKLGARNRTQAVAIAAQRGLIHPLDTSSTT